MSISKRILVSVVCLLVLASAAMAALHPPVKITKEQVQNYYGNLKAGGAAPAVDPRTILRSRGTSATAVPGFIRTDSRYGAKLLTSELGYGQGLGVGTRGDYVLLNDGNGGNLFVYKNGALTDFGYISRYYLAAGRMWGHYYFGDWGGNLFRLEADNHTITPVIETNIGGLQISGLDIDHTTGLVFFAINVFVGSWAVDFFAFDPATDFLYDLGDLDSDLCYGVAVKGNYLYFSLWYDNVILRWNWKKGGDPERFTDRVSGPADIIFDPKGNLFVCDYSSGSILKFNPTGTMRTRIAWDIYDPEYLGLDQRGDVFFDTSSGEVWKLRKK